ncbi:4-oxalocrotonate tautomerase [Pleomassaria siparia CBS 279.74]|uniref:4-oxalocrotonate tautomerase n=1 Tax=Pleomassaria siparia CBS 279.74 TaxID=1314801 RepID=A0A6G1KKM8_9PLEO|nr:4-oxalocrotonate tautomerase [Pleomassaria siparia CBS 279.74]
MPLINIHVIKDQRSPSELRKLADTIHQCILKDFNAPPGDRYQVITQHQPEELIIEDTGLGIPRTNNIVLLQIFQQGRDTKDKQRLFAALAEQLKSQCGLEGSDLVVTLMANSKADWSFGYGKAQFLTGQL